MNNKALKAEMLQSGKYSEIKKYDKALYKATNFGIASIIDTSEAKEGAYKLIQDNAPISLSDDEIISYKQLNDARRQQNKRIADKMAFYIYNGYQLAFGTFTFNNNALKLKPSTRKQYVRRLIAASDKIVDYIGNIDYGTKNEREHYHYILVLAKDFEPSIKVRTITSKTTRKYNSIENLDLGYSKGFATYELIGNENSDGAKIKNYITKLSLHSLKVKQSQIIAPKDDTPYKVGVRRWERRKSELRDINNGVDILKEYTQVVNELMQISDNSFSF